MLTFRNTNIFFAGLLIILVTTDILYDLPHPLIIFSVLLLSYSLLLFYGCCYIQSGFFLKAYCSAKTVRKEIAISFDDGPAGTYTARILEMLKANSVQAVFFCIGKKLRENENILKQLAAEGHIIGNHSYTHHFFFDLFSSGRMLAELIKTDRATERITGLRPKLFRPPYGVLNPNLRKAIQDGSYIPVGWSVRSVDTVIKNEKKLFSKIAKALKPGAVYLFHDTSAATLAVLPAFIQHVKGRGYEIVRLDKMLALQPYA